MPIDADHPPAQSDWSGALPRLAGVAVVLEPVADTTAVAATDTGSLAGPPMFEQPPAPLDAEENATAATPVRSASGRGAMALVVVPLGGSLAVLAAVVAVNATNDWWALIPAMSIAVVATACVLATVVRMLADND